MQLLPAPIQGLPTDTRICDASGSLLLSDRGEVFRVAYECEPNITFCWPREGWAPFVESVPGLEQLRIVAIASAAGFDIFVTEQGEALYLCEPNMDKLRVSQPRPVTGPCLRHVRHVRAASCSGSMAILVSEDGFFSFGSQNNCGLAALGQGEHPLHAAGGEHATPLVLLTLGRVAI
jgi:hypothetical protein